MKESAHDGRMTVSRAWSSVSSFRLNLETETLLFVIASAMDVVMTWKMITGQFANGKIWFVESNPVARYILYSWGLDAMVYFKISMVCLVVAICQLIARTRADVARRLLICATALVAAVVLYSVSLVWPHL